MGEVTSALAALIDRTEEANQWSDADVARRAEGHPTRLTPQDISNWRHNGMKQLVPGKVVVLAHGLGLPAYRVAVAVLADLGIDVPLDARSPEAAIHHDHTLSDASRNWLLTVLERERARG